MTIQLQPTSYFVFDLDDTLFSEIDFLISGFRSVVRHLGFPNWEEVAEQMIERYQKKENAFSWLESHCSVKGICGSVHDFLEHYRAHFPEIKLAKEVADFLEVLRERNIPMGLITDGRSVSQRNKLKALGIEKYFSDLIISEEFGSEKPDPRNYHYFVEKYPNKHFYFFGDNTTKDFIVPRVLGWNLFCIKDNGSNIHKQDLSGFSSTEIITSFKEINFQ